MGFRFDLVYAVIMAFLLAVSLTFTGLVPSLVETAQAPIVAY
jgi:putative exporter of polyketide antibiotics